MVTQRNLHRWRPQRKSKEARAHGEAALRMIAALIAVEAPDPDSDRRGHIVAVINQVARRAAALRLRIAYDGDRYYVTHPAPTANPASPILGTVLEGVSGEVTETLLVSGRAETLEELEALVNRIGSGG